MISATNRSSLLLIFFLCAGLAAMQAQSPGPRKPPVPNVSVKPLNMAKTEMVDAGKLSAFYFKAVLMDSATYEIRSYQVSVFGKGRNPDLDMQSTRDSIPARIIERIKTYVAGSKIFFEYVKATNKTNGKLVSIPPISVTLND